MAGEPGADLEVRGLRSVFVILVLIGVGGLGLAAAFEALRGPYALFVFGVATLLGIVGILDRRVKLALSSEGIRYARWGPAVIPWREFAGYRLTAWRRNVYLQLVPRRPPYVLERFSRLGRLNNRCAGLIGSPPFSIAVTPLAITDRQLAAVIGHYLPPLAEL